MNPLLTLVALSGCAGTCPVDPSPWATGETAFTEATSDWGLDEIGATGLRLTAVDFNGDGWADLAVRSSGPNTAEARTTWLLRNTGEGTFEDVTDASGILANRGEGDAGRPGQVWVWGDVDNDGDLDVYTGLPDAKGDFTETSEIMLNNGDGTFELGPENSAVRRGAGDMPYGAAFVDVDRDGDLDLWTGQYDNTSQQADRLMMGSGDGGFAPADGSGISSVSWNDTDDLNNARAHTRSWAAAACDLNNDGAPELLSSSYGRSPNHLWQNAGDGTFTNVSVASGYAYDDRLDWSDNESARCWCTLHPEAEDCSGVPAPELISCNTDDDAFRWSHNFDREPFRLGGNSGATLCGDLDNDGFLDLLTTEIVHWDVGTSSDPSELLFNTGSADVSFTRPGNETTGMTRTHDITAWNDGDITGSLFDFDNDGFLDVYLGSSDYPSTRGLLYRNNGDRTVTSVPLDEGIDHKRSHGSAVADFDHDGDLDIVVGHSTFRCEGECYETAVVRLFENKVGSRNGWVRLDLIGTGGSNRSAIGARIDVKAGDLSLTRFVDGGHGQWGQQDELVQTIGLSGECSAEVTITWPDADLTQETFSVKAGETYTIEQGGKAKRVK